MTHLILIRHGETDWNIEGRWQGQTDIPLNNQGLRQADEIAKALSQTEIHAIFSSDLLRAHQTAEILACLKNLPVHVDRRLREIHQGEWQGLLISEIQKRYVIQFQDRQKEPLNTAPPGGETAAQVQQRALAAIRHIVRQYPSQTVAVISHGFTLATVLVYYQKKPFEKVWESIPPNAAILHLRIPPFSTHHTSSANRSMK